MTTSWPDRLIEAGALFLLVFTPLAYGTVNPWSEAVAELVILGMALTYVIRTLRAWELRVELPPGWLPALLFLGLIFLQAVLPGWSLDPHATWRQALKLAAVAALFLICYNTYRTRAQAQRALWTMIVMGTFISLFGIAQRMTWHGRLYWIGPEVSGSPFGPFVNRTHFAGLMIVVVPAALAFLLADKQAARHHRWARTWRDRLLEWGSSEAGPRQLIGVLVLVMGGAALVSGSRGGMVALLGALFAMILGSLAHRRSWSGRAGRLALATALIVLAGIWLGGDIIYGTAERIAEELERPDESPRLQLWADALGLWRGAPLLGTGLASFAVAFPPIRTIRAPVVYSHAESDWVQLLTDTGLIGLSLALTAVTALALALLRRYRQTEGRWARSLALAGLVALIGTAIQGIANHNLPVMSNFIYLAVAVALAARSGASASGGPSPASRSREPER